MMARSIRFDVFLFFAICIVAPLTVSSKELEDRNWIEVQTENFQIRSLMNEKKSVELARNLEVFRAVVSVLTGTDRLTSPVPTDIYLLSGGGASQDFGMGGTTAGFFRTGLRNNTMVVRDTVGMDETAIIMHEYVHFLARSHSSVNYPLWYNEGFAEYLSTIEIENDIVTVGRIPEYRMASFTRSVWIPISRIVYETSYDEFAPQELHKFYAESWGLVHYLNHRKDSDRPFNEQLQHYLKLLDSGEDSVESFEEAFAISMTSLNSRLRRYVYGQNIPGFSFSVDDLGIEVNTEVTEPSREEISLTLGQYALGTGELEMAENWFTIAASDEQYRPQAEAGLGDILKFQDKFEEAEPHFEKAIELAPDDPNIQLDMAEYWHSRADDTEEKDLEAIYAKRARRYYVNAWKIDNSLPEVYAMYGRTFMLGDANYTKAVEMLEQAEQLLPSDIGIRMVLAEAYLGAGQIADATRLARSVLAWAHGSEEASKRAQDVIDKASETTEP